MKRLLSIALVCLPFLGKAQTFDDYVKLRKKYGITQAVGIPALETLLGKRVCELKGTVKGVMTSTKGALLLLEKTDGDYMHVVCVKAPEWLVGNEISVRLLVEARRETETSELEATLIGAAPESKVAALEIIKEPAKKQPVAVKPPRQVKEWNLPASSATPIYAGFIKQRNKRLSDAQAIHIAEGVIGFSLRYGVDARLIMAMVMCESNFNPSAVSRAGAQGLGQLMPGTARGMGVIDPFDAKDNLNATVRLIRGHINKYQRQTGDEYDGLVLALAAYNAGSGAVRKFDGVPPYKETQAYIRKVISLYNQLCGR